MCQVIRVKEGWIQEYLVVLVIEPFVVTTTTTTTTTIDITTPTYYVSIT